MIRKYGNLIYCYYGDTDACFEGLKDLLKKYDYVILLCTEDIYVEKLIEDLGKEFRDLIVEDIRSGKELGVDYIIKLRRV